MFIKNPEITIDREKIFPCKSNKLSRFLTQEKKIMYVSRVLDKTDNKWVWLFIRNEILANALIEWKTNKDNGTFVYSKKETEVEENIGESKDD